MTIKKYKQIDDLLSSFSQSTLPESMRHQLSNAKQRWHHWLNRYHVYAGVDAYRHFNKWQTTPKLSYLEQKLINALSALQEITQYQAKSTFERKQIMNMQRAILRLIDIQISKMEIAQLKKLQKIQGISRDGLESMETALHEKRKSSNNIIEGRDIRFSERAAEYHLKITKKLFWTEENKFHFSKQIKRMNVASDTITVGKTGTDITTAVASSLPGIITFSQAAQNILSAIPIVSTIAMAAPLVFNSIKTWAQNKSSSKKIGASIALGITGGALLTAIMVPVAALGMAAGLAGIGFIAQHLLPYIGRRMTISGKQAEITEIEKRINDINKQSPHQVIRLTTLEKHALLKEIEHLQEKRGNEAYINHAKRLIIDGVVNDAFKKNAVINQALNHYQKHNIGKSSIMSKSMALQCFLTDTNVQRTRTLDTEIRALKKQEGKQLANLINNIISFAGAVLVCIPTPPTMILGACLMGASAVAGIAIKYDLHKKIGGFFSRLFSSSKNKQPETAAQAPSMLEPHTPTPAPTMENDASLTVSSTAAKIFAKLTENTPAPSAATVALTHGQVSAAEQTIAAHPEPAVQRKRGSAATTTPETNFRPTRRR